MERGNDASAGESIYLPFPVRRDEILCPKNVRSTLLASSLRTLREHGHLDAYLQALDPRWRETILECVAGVWLPVEAGIAHYAACDALPLSTPQRIQLGREVGDRVNGTFLGTMVRAAKSAGATPWGVLAYTNRLYARLFDGGGCCVWKLGPKDARLEVVENPLPRFGYFRDAVRGMWGVAMELFCRKAYLTVIGHTDTSIKVKISWA